MVSNIPMNKDKALGSKNNKRNKKGGLAVPAKV